MALESNRLVAGYSGREVIRGVDLTLNRGRLICLLGPNGSGKSTLVRALCGILPHSDGQVRLDGRDLHELSPAARARKIGFLPQEVQPGFSFRVHEAVALGARCAGQGSWFRSGGNPEMDAAVRRALQAVDAVDLIDRHLDHLSGGERRRVLLASVLAQAPQYLLLDEPTAMLDLEHQVSLFERLAELAAGGGQTDAADEARLGANAPAEADAGAPDTGLGVLVVTHDLNLAARWADQILLLQNGEITASGTPAEVLVREKLEPVFGPRFDLLKTEAGHTAVVPN